MTYEGLRLKALKYYRKALQKKIRKELKTENFTIISNNCWGGMIYESYGIQKMSPTVGMFFMAEDYLEFLSHLEEYLKTELSFIKPENSKWKDKYSAEAGYPIGVLKRGEKSVEIFFLHYKSEKDAKEKWDRRVKRVNFDKLLVKFNDQNGCTEEDIKRFDALPFKNKICFTVKSYPYESVIKINAPKSHKFVRASYEPLGKSKYVNMTDIINNL